MLASIVVIVTGIVINTTIPLRAELTDGAQQMLVG